MLEVEARRMGNLARITKKGTVSATAANSVAEAMLTREDAAEMIVEDLRLIQVQDVSATETWVDEALAANQKAANDAFTSCKKMKAAISFVRGQVMRLSGGKADPTPAGELSERRLATLREDTGGVT